VCEDFSYTVAAAVSINVFVVMLLYEYLYNIFATVFILASIVALNDVRLGKIATVNNAKIANAIITSNKENPRIIYLL